MPKLYDFLNDLEQDVIKQEHFRREPEAYVAAIEAAGIHGEAKDALVARNRDRIIDLLHAEVPGVSKDILPIVIFPVLLATTARSEKAPVKRKPKKGR